MNGHGARVLPNKALGVCCRPALRAEVYAGLSSGVTALYQHTFLYSQREMPTQRLTSARWGR